MQFQTNKMSDYLNNLYGSDSENDEDESYYYGYVDEQDNYDDDDEFDEEEEPTASIDLFELAKTTSKKPTQPPKKPSSSSSLKKKAQEPQWTFNNQSDPLSYLSKRRNQPKWNQQQPSSKQSWNQQKSSSQQQQHLNQQEQLDRARIIFTPKRPVRSLKKFGFSTLYQYLRTEFEKQFSTGAQALFETYDLRLRFLNGLTLGVHAYFLSARSVYFRDLIRNHSNGYGHDEIPEMAITNRSYESLLHYLRMLYGCDMDHVKQSEMDELKDILQQDFMTEKFREAQICKKSSNRMHATEMDMARYYSKNMIMNGTGYSTDLILKVIDPLDDSVELCEFHVHKFILCRSTFIQSIIKSGMEESHSGIIRFSDVSPSAFEKFIQYMYTNVMKISEQDAVELFNLSLIMELAELAEMCRNVIIDSIDADNVFSILTLLILMRDEEVATACRDVILEALNQDNAYEWAMMELMDNNQHIVERCASLLALKELSDEMVQQLPVDVRVAMHRNKLEMAKKQSKDAIKKRAKTEKEQALGYQ